MHPFQLALLQLPQLCLLQVPVQKTRHMFCLMTLTEDIHMDRAGSDRVGYIIGQSPAPSANDKTSNNDSSSKRLARHPC